MSIDQETPKLNTLDKAIESKKTPDIVPVEFLGVDTVFAQVPPYHAQDFVYINNPDGSVAEKYSPNDSYQHSHGRGEYSEVDMGDKKLRVIVTNEESVHAAFLPTRDVYKIGPASVKQLDQDPQLFYSSMLHEAMHDRFFALPQSEQEKINSLFVDNDNRRAILLKFARTLYGDEIMSANGKTAGENYLSTHEASEKNNSSLALESEKGVKDKRALSFGDGKQNHKVWLGLLVSEMLSYMSSLVVSRDCFEKTKSKGLALRGGKDGRHDVARELFDTLNNDAELKKILVDSKLFADRSNDFLKNMIKLTNKN